MDTMKMDILLKIKKIQDKLYNTKKSIKRFRLQRKLNKLKEKIRNN